MNMFAHLTRCLHWSWSSPKEGVAPQTDEQGRVHRLSVIDGSYFSPTRDPASASIILQ